MLPFDFALERHPKNIFYYHHDVENYRDQVLNFLYLIDMNIYTRNLPVCNSGQHTYATGLFNFFFVLQDLIDRIDFYFQRITFQRNLLLIGFQHSTSQVFFDVNRQPSLEWRCKGLILLCQSIFEMRRITHLHGSAHFTIPLTKWMFMIDIKIEGVILGNF